MEGGRDPSVPTAGGNTKPLREVSPAKKWVTTIFCDPKIENFLEEIIKLFSLHCDKWGIGEETCPSTGKKHLQCWLEFAKKNRPKTVFKTNWHWEVMKGTIEDSIKYCSKEGKYHTNYTPFKLKDPLEGKELYYWQKEVMEIVSKEPDDRKIYWFYDREGNCGKSSLCKHLAINKKAHIIDGKPEDVYYVLANEKPENIKCVILDLPRSTEGHIRYDMIEKIKNGMFLSGKYESKCVLYNPPHLFIFANFAPTMKDIVSVSKDRWDIRCARRSGEQSAPPLAYAYPDINFSEY